MKTSKEMHKIITKLAKKHGLDLTASEAHLRLDMPGFDRLVIEKISQHLVSVAHYYEQAGDLIADPEIVFFTGYRVWVPIEVTQVIGGHRVYTTLKDDGQEIAKIAIHEQADLADFAKIWASNIEAQGWFENGIRWNPCSPDNYQAPDMDTLNRWQDEGGCDAIDGCWVEPDGTCQHGCKSWLLELGLI